MKKLMNRLTSSRTTKIRFELELDIKLGLEVWSSQFIELVSRLNNFIPMHKHENKEKEIVERR